jgi:hypothetical protein
MYSDEFREEADKGGQAQYPSEVVLHPDRKWLYVSNRGHGAILQESIYSAQNFSDIFGSSNFGQCLTQKLRIKIYLSIDVYYGKIY